MTFLSLPVSKAVRIVGDNLVNGIRVIDAELTLTSSASRSWQGVNTTVNIVGILINEVEVVGPSPDKPPITEHINEPIILDTNSFKVYTNTHVGHMWSVILRIYGDNLNRRIAMFIGS